MEGLEPFLNLYIHTYSRRGGRAAEGNGLLNRHSSNKGYRGFESLSLRIKQKSLVYPGFLFYSEGFEPDRRVRTAAQAAMIDLQVNPVRGELRSSESLPLSPHEKQYPGEAGVLFFTLRGIELGKRVRPAAMLPGR